MPHTMTAPYTGLAAVLGHYLFHGLGYICHGVAYLHRFRAGSLCFLYYFQNVPYLWLAALAEKDRPQHLCPVAKGPCNLRRINGSGIPLHSVVSWTADKRMRMLRAHQHQRILRAMCPQVAFPSAYHLAFSSTYLYHLHHMLKRLHRDAGGLSGQLHLKFGFRLTSLGVGIGNIHNLSTGIQYCLLDRHRQLGGRVHSHSGLRQPQLADPTTHRFHHWAAVNILIRQPTQTAGMELLSYSGDNQPRHLTRLHKNKITTSR